MFRQETASNNLVHRDGQDNSEGCKQLLFGQQTALMPSKRRTKCRRKGRFDKKNEAHPQTRRLVHPPLGQRQPTHEFSVVMASATKAPYLALCTPRPFTQSRSLKRSTLTALSQSDASWFTTRRRRIAGVCFVRQHASALACARQQT